MKIDPKKIKDLLSIMKKNQIKRLRYRIKDEEIELELPSADHASFGQFHHMPQVTTHPTFAHTVSEKQEEAPKKDAKYITSPLVGTFYSKPSPDSKSFVDPGHSVDENMIVCIVEAMKVMNEVKAETQGKIVEVLIEDGQAVEFGTKLFRVE
jgi:acetyl-CoA carboxylase biotin carboxyl carrier protein